MYKIIKMSLDLEDMLVEYTTLELLPESFDSISAARNHIFAILKNNAEEWANLYSDDDDINTSVEEISDDDVNIINYLDNEQQFLEKYKIVEVK